MHIIAQPVQDIYSYSAFNKILGPDRYYWALTSFFFRFNEKELQMWRDQNGFIRYIKGVNSILKNFFNNIGE